MSALSSAAAAASPLTVAGAFTAVAPVFAVAEALAIVGAAALAVFTWSLAEAEEDPRLAWVAPGFTIAALALLGRVIALPDYAPGGGPLGTTPDGVYALALLWRLSLLAFVALGIAGASPKIRRPLVLCIVAAMSVVVSVDSGLPSLVVDGSFTGLARGTHVFIAVAMAAVAAAWFRSAGSDIRASETWTGIVLLLGAASSVLWSLAPARLSVLWWEAILVASCQMFVPACGLALAYVRHHMRLAAFLKRQADRLDEAIESLYRDRSPEARLDDPAPDISAIIADPLGVRIVFQPIFDLRTSMLVGLEALARFPDDAPPHHWFARAEGAGLGAELELRALRAALQALDLIGPDMFLSVNVSGRTLLDPRLRAAIEPSQLERLTFELTEHDIISDYAALAEEVGDLRRAGAKLAIDDLGAGFSSLRHVLRLRPNLLKLDRSMVEAVAIDPVQRSMATAIVRFGAETGTVVVAEGIETAEQADLLRAIGVDWGQGYYLAMPGALDDIEAWEQRMQARMHRRVLP